ncbi:hypothetical protein C8R41DRAFT_870691 [Lentinula lateritia]|uniref:Uncharacterized protein n=1 Tax=Lentinula lateritia TaxID=40482 RepID=A0ABQ8V5N3_9AGAR|nr:hypothetical protein C8R41DRAFT_870691 [Lentinula lateritia]
MSRYNASCTYVDADGTPVEDGVSRVAKAYAQKGKLARRIMRETLGGRKNYQLFICPSVSDARLKEFEQNPQAHGPKIRNTFIDKRGLTTQHLSDWPWNQQVTYIMARNAEEIVKNCKDMRFGDKMDWLALFSERIYRVYLDIIKGRPITLDAGGTKENSQQI